MFTPTEILYTFVYKKFPMGWILKSCAILQVLGTWLRLFVISANSGKSPDTEVYSFAWITIGNFIVAWTNAPVQMATIKVSERWFGPEERTIAVAGQSLAFVIGGIAGFIIGPFFVTSNATVEDVYSFLWVQSIVITIFSVPAIFLFAEKPKLPTSLSQENMPKISSKEDLQLLCKNKNFHLLVWNFTMSTVIYDLIALLVDPLCFGYFTEAWQVASFAVAFVLCGVVGLVIVTVILDKKKKYLLVQRVFSWCSLIVMILCTLTLKTGNYPLFLTLIGLGGFFIIPTTASAIAFAGEVSYPVE